MHPPNGKHEAFKAESSGGDYWMGVTMFCLKRRGIITKSDIFNRT